MTKTTKKSSEALNQARRRWGRADVLSGNPTPTTNPQPAPKAPAATMKARRAA